MSLRRSKSELRQEQSAVRQGSNLHKQRFDGTQTARLRFDAITNSGFPAMNGQRIVLPLQPPLPPFVYNMPGRYSMFLQHCGPLPPPAPLRFLLPPLGPPTAFPAIPPHRKLQFDEWHHQDALRNASMLSLAQIDGDSPILDNGITPRQSTPVHGSVAASQPIDIRRCQSPLLRSSPEETRVSAKSSIDVTVASVLNPHAVAFQPSTSCILVPVPSGPKATCLPFPVYELPAEASRPFPFIFDRVEVLQKLDFPNASNHAFYDLRWTSDDGDAAAHSEGQATPAASNISASSSQITPRRRRSLLQVQDPITGEDVIERERIQSAEMNNSSQQSFSDSFSSTTSDGSLTPVADAFGNIMKPPLCHREADRPMLSAKMGTPPSSKISSHRHSSLACSEAMPKVTSRPNGNNAVGSYGLQSARNASNRNASLASSGKQPLKGLAPERIGDITFGDFANEEVGVESSDSPNADTANTSSTDKTMIAVSSLHSPSKEAIRSDESKVLSERGLETAEVSSELQLEREDTGRCDEVLQSGSGACRMVYSREFAMALGELPCCKLKPDFLSDASRTDELAAIAVTPEERHSLLLGPQTNGCISPRKPFTFASGHSADSENDSFVPSFCKPATAEASLPSQADNDIRAVDDVNVFKVPQAPGPRNAKRRQSRSSSRSISRSPRRQPQNEISVPDRSATDAKQPERIVIRSSINEEVKLASAGANAWVPRIKRQAESQEQQLTEEQTAQELLRKARGIFNRITPETFDELLKDFMELKIVGEESWTVVIDECFSKVVKDYKTYGQLYTRLFVKVHEQPPDPSITDPKMQTTYVFFQKLITKCQSEFLEVHPKFVALEEEKQRAIDAIDSPAEKAALQTELLEMQQKERIRYTGTVMFVGELYLVKLLTATIVEHCFAVLCPPKGLEEENLQLACMLMCRIGSKFEKDKKKCVEQFQRLLELALANLEIAGVTKFHIREVIESRKKNWKSTRSLDSAEMKPQTLEQVEYALAKERAWKEEKLREYNKQMAEAATGSNRRHEASAEATPQNGGYHGVVDNSAWFAQPQRQEKCWAPRRDAADRKTTTSDSDDESGPLFERKELSKYLNGPNVSLRPEKSFNAWKMRASSKT